MGASETGGATTFLVSCLGAAGVALLADCDAGLTGAAGFVSFALTALSDGLATGTRAVGLLAAAEVGLLTTFAAALVATLATGLATGLLTGFDTGLEAGLATTFDTGLECALAAGTGFFANAFAGAAFATAVFFAGRPSVQPPFGPALAFSAQPPF